MVLKPINRVASLCTVTIALALLVGCDSTGITLPHLLRTCGGVWNTSLDTWPSWGPLPDGFSFRHQARDSTDSTYIAIADAAGVVAARFRISSAVELASCEDCPLVAFGYGQISVWDMANHEVRQVTNTRNFAHWPEWAPGGRFLSYSRIHGSPTDPASYGLRVLDVETGQDLPLMRTATRPWYAHGRASWSPDGSSLAFFDADTGRVTEGRDEFRLVVVPRGGGDGRTIGWTGGTPLRASWLPSGDAFLFDARSVECLRTELSRRSYRMDAATGRVERTQHELGDAHVQFGFPFFISKDGTTSMHVGAGPGGKGIIVATDVASGVTRALTAP